LLARLGLRKAADDKADPLRLAAVGAAVRARLAEDPRAEPRGGHDADLFAVPGFASPGECAALLAMIEHGARPSPLFNDGGSGRTDIRTSSTHYFGSEPPALELGRRIDGLLGLDRAHGEPLQGQRYRAGEHYRHHTDVFRPERDHWQRERLRGGQRTWTAMLYLNEVQAGGSTDFPRLGVSIRPEAGLLVAWDNMDRKGRPNRALLHAGTPVERGAKYVVTQWYRLEPWRRLDRA
jgi:prolyl 4-hydroxylase